MKMEFSLKKFCNNKSLRTEMSILLQTTQIIAYIFFFSHFSCSKVLKKWKSNFHRKNFEGPKKLMQKISPNNVLEYILSKKFSVPYATICNLERFFFQVIKKWKSNFHKKNFERPKNYSKKYLRITF